MPIEFSLDGVIAGWQEGIPGMKVGGKRRLVIPSEKAYGADGVCRTYNEDNTVCTEYNIPQNADLVFEVELMSVRR